MYQFSIAPSDFLAPGFEQKLALCEETRCGYVELSDIIEGNFIGDMDGDTIACCYLYRKDKVKPYTDLRIVFNNPKNFYHYYIVFCRPVSRQYIKINRKIMKY